MVFRHFVQHLGGLADSEGDAAVQGIQQQAAAQVPAGSNSCKNYKPEA
jgi:hypothetical protein